MTECTEREVRFRGPGRREVVGRFDGGEITSDSGVMLLGETDRRIELLNRLAECFVDHREPSRVEHGVRELVAQRVFGVCLGYEDLNDHDVLRKDSLFATIVGKRDPSGASRRERDRGHSLAGSRTLNRLELSTPEEAASHRYKRIHFDQDAADALLVELFLEAHTQAPDEIILDVDATDDRLHGRQEGRFFHGYYDCYCYLPLYIFSGDHLLGARLRRSNIDGAAGTLDELQRIVGQIRDAWPETRIVIRGDSGFARDELMAWCEQQKLDYVLGLARNTRLEAELGPYLEHAEAVHEESGKKETYFTSFMWRTKSSWARRRRVIGKAEWSRRGGNPRFVVTSLACSNNGDAERIYREIYCARGDMENRIKEQQLDLFADRTSTHSMRANETRLYFASFAYVLMNALRRIGLVGTQMVRAQCGTIRLRLLKIGARTRVTARRVWVHMSNACPWADEFLHVWRMLRAA